MTTVDAALQTLRAHIAKKDAATGVFLVRWVGDERVFCLNLSTSPPQLSEGAAALGACAIGFHPDDVADLCDGKVTLRALYDAGRFRAFGPLADAMKLSALFQ